MKKRTPKSALRITAWIKTAHDGNTKAAAKALGCEHTALWRAATGTAVRGPNPDVVSALIRVAGETFDYWTGRAK